MTEDTQKEKPQDGLALIIGGLFILALVFAAYNYFSTGKDTQNEDMTDQEQIIDEEKGDLNGGGAKDTRNGDTTMKNDSKTADSTISMDSEENMWEATNYNEGDIKGGSYTVKTGDTLWEIAEGAYGDGSMWTQVLGANQANIGFLANGQQALIVPGQVLVLP